MNMEQTSALYKELQGSSGFLALIKQLEASLDSLKRGVFSDTPNEKTPFMVAKAQGFQLCLDLMKNIPANSASAYHNYQAAEKEVWGVE